MGSRKRKSHTGSATAVPPRSSGSRTVGERILRVGVLCGAFVTPATFILLGGNAFGPPKAVVFAWSCVAVLLGLLLDRGLRERTAALVRSSALAWAAIALVVVASAATAMSGRGLTALAGGYPDYRGLLLMLGCAVLGTGAAVMRGDRAWLGRATSLLIAWVAIVAIGERFGLPPAALKLPGAVRTISTAGNASNLGVLLAIALPLSAGSALGEQRKVWRVVAWMAWAGGLLALVWTQSRGAWAGSAAALVVGGALAAFGAKSQRGSAPAAPRVHWVFMAATAVAALAVATALTPGVVARASSSLDMGSSTAAWRLSTWRSAVQMTADRPLLGFGPDSFRLAYPAYKEPGQDDGRLGYVPTESAHNLMLDTSTSLGVMGALALIAVIGIAAFALTSRLRRPRPDEAFIAMEYAPVAAALVGGLVALQFHYVTLDTAPLVAVLLGTVVALQVPGEAPAGRLPLRAVIVTSLAAIILFAAAGTAAVAVVAADSRAGRARALVEGGAPWPEILEATRFAQRVAPWESAFFRDEGRAAGALVSSGRAPQAAADGMAAYAIAVELSPDNPFLLSEQAHLVLAVAIDRRDPILAQEAGDLFARAAELDPGSGIPLAGVGRSALVRLEFDSARESLERAVELSPSYAPAWADLGRTYSEMGLTDQADHAEEQAARLKAASIPD